jgi:sporulation protein YlmC with PRC-barrel domain
MDRIGGFQPISALRGRRVVDPDGKAVGRIHDVLLDLRDGRIEYICIALSETAGAARREAVVPWSALRVDLRAGRWQVAARRSVIEDIAQPIPPRV